MFWGLALFVVVLIVAVYSGIPVLWTRTLHRSSRRYTNAAGRVALTFDDGPHPVYTPKLLDVLKEKNTKATFFVIVKKALQYPQVIERMLLEGHEVQVHGYRHHFVPFLHPRATANQCLGAKRALHNRFEVESTVYRPPWGACNLVTLWLLKRHRITMCLWSVMVGDWRKTDPTLLVQKISARLTNRSIIVLHDSDDTFGAEATAPENVIAAMHDIIDIIRGRGYDFVPISECVKGGA